MVSFSFYICLLGQINFCSCGKVHHLKWVGAGVVTPGPMFCLHQLNKFTLESQNQQLIALSHGERLSLVQVIVQILGLDAH